MNIITKSDITKFLRLLKAGLEDGKQKELTTYSSESRYDGTDVAKDYYVSLSFSFRVSPDKIEEIIHEDSMDNDIKELFKTIQP